VKFALALALVAMTAQAAEPPIIARKYQRPLTAAAHYAWGLDAPIPVLASQVHQESSWNESAVSSAGAQGLAQFIPSTATWLDALYADELGPKQPLNPSWALRALVRYDLYLFERTAGATECDTWRFTLAQYNGGSARLEREQLMAAQQGLDALRWINVAPFNAGRSESNWRENRGYPVAILKQRQPLYLAWGREIKCLD